ncbi:hypothetical protein AB0958_10975 [Streptomyces sp. NPDC006655]
MSDRTTAVHDLATGIQRNTVEWPPGVTRSPANARLAYEYCVRTPAAPRR